MLKNREINGTEEIGLVTPTPDHQNKDNACKTQRSLSSLMVDFNRMWVTNFDEKYRI